MNTTTKRLINTALATTAVLAGLSVAPAASAVNTTPYCVTAAENARVRDTHPMTRAQAHAVFGQTIGEMISTVTYRGDGEDGYPYSYTIQRRAYPNCATTRSRYWVSYVRNNTGPHAGIFWVRGYFGD